MSVAAQLLLLYYLLEKEEEGRAAEMKIDLGAAKVGAAFTGMDSINLYLLTG